MSGKCEICANSRIVVSENGIHPICCLSEKKAIDCHIGTKDHYISLVGKCKFDEEITEAQDLSDIKFIDEDGNEVELDPTLWETPPPLVAEYTGTLAINFPDGRTIENPSPEEFLEWAKGTQIPVYYVDESEDTTE